jgi:hypothetical protein
MTEQNLISDWIKQLYSIPIWKKYSQANEESYLEHILNNVPSINKHIVEFGAWDGFHLSNTRYFIEKGYTALLIDGDNKGNEEVKQHFIYRENCLELLKLYETPKQFDLFCIDLDGNDIYILEEVLLEYKPSVVIAEFNPIFNEGVSMAIRYNANHTWSEDDFYGFSFTAGIKLASKFGYTCIFQNNNLNMYFVKNEFLKDVEIPKVNYQVTFGHPKSKKIDWVEY